VSVVIPQRSEGICCRQQSHSGLSLRDEVLNRFRFFQDQPRRDPASLHP
jgi:hypothetical protein